jgi:hypothetical protein
VESSNPITDIADCCARVASGHAAAPLSNVMNSRRLTARTPFTKILQQRLNERLAEHVTSTLRIPAKVSKASGYQPSYHGVR